MREARNCVGISVLCSLLFFFHPSCFGLWPNSRLISHSVTSHLRSRFFFAFLSPLRFLHSVAHSFSLSSLSFLSLFSARETILDSFSLPSSPLLRTHSSQPFVIDLHISIFVFLYWSDFFLRKFHYRCDYISKFK